MNTPSWQTGKNRVNARLINPGDTVVTKEVTGDCTEWTSTVLEVNIQRQTLVVKIVSIGDSPEHDAIGKNMDVYALDVFDHQPQ